MIYSRLTGTGSYLPEKVLTNHELASMVDTSHDWIMARTGIAERRIAAEDEFTCDIAEKAALSAMESAGVSPADIDLVVVATTTPDKDFPTTACLLQERLGIRGCPAFDIQAVCAGFIFALDVANRFVKTQGAKCALVVGAETFSRIIDWTDRGTCILFGDGGGAVVLQADEKPGILSTHLHSDGTYKDLLCVPAGVSKQYDAVRNGTAFTTMNGGDVFRWAVTAMSDLVSETLDANGMTTDDVDWLIPHQANVRIINAVGRRAGFPAEKVIVTVAHHGNTSAASVPLALDESIRSGIIRSGDTILMEGFGGGFTWGSVLLRL